jgi:hypothetical protein
LGLNHQWHHDPPNPQGLRRIGRDAAVCLVVVDVVVVDGFVFNRSLFSVMNGLQLMAIGQVSVVSGRYHVVLVVSFSSQELVLCCGFKVVSSGTVMFGCVVMNFVFVCSCHDDLNVLIRAIWKIQERSRNGYEPDS